METKRGISLIVLVVTVIILGILATAVIISLENSNIIGMASDSLSQDRISKITEVANTAYSELLLEHGGNLSAITSEAIKDKMIELGVNESDLQGIEISFEDGIKVSQIQNGDEPNIELSLVNYKIYGNSIQNGVPTPEAPVEIQSVGDKTKNLFNQLTTKTASFSTVSNSSARTFQEGVWYRGLTYNNYSYPQNLLDYNVGTSTTMVKVNGQLLYGLAQAFRVEPKQIYSFSYDGGEGGNVALGFYDQEGKILSYKYWTYGSTINIPADAYWMTICLSGSTANIEISYSNIQLVLGTEPTSYEPYGYKIPIKVTTDGNTTLHNIYLAEPLRKVGEHKDYIDFATGKVVRRIVAKVFDGTENLNAFDSSITANCPYPYTYYKIGALGVVENDICLSTHLEHQPTFGYRVEGENKFRVLNSEGNGDARLVFRLYSEGAIVEEAIKVKEILETYYAKGTPMVVYYAHAEKYEQSQNLDLPEIYAAKGTTSITIDTEISPSEFVLNYE